LVSTLIFCLEDVPMSDLFRRFLLLLMLACTWITGLPVLGRAQEETDEDGPFLAGLIADYRDINGHTAVRLDFQLAFHWGEQPPDPRLTAGEFRAHWQGNFLAVSRGAYRFFVFGCGEVELKIAGRVVIARQSVRNGWASSAAISLTADYHTLELSFRRTEQDARLMLLWSGPDFGLEPVPARFLYHPRQKSVERNFERGRLLARVLRCGRCHGEESPAAPAPALDRLRGNLSRTWLVRWLADNEHGSDEHSPRRMPALGLSATQAEVLADWLLMPRGPEHEAARREGYSRAERRNDKSKPDAKTGERLFVSLGCLACHRWRDLGASGWLSGGDLTHSADKRPSSFFAVWLAEPSRLNRDHRMPVFKLSNRERTSLALFLAEQKGGRETLPTPPNVAAERSHAGPVNEKEGRKLAEQFGCAACHRLPDAVRDTAGHSAPQLNERSNWERSCLDFPEATRHRPGYRLNKDDARALRCYYSAVRSNPRDGLFLLAEHNCLACHAREGAREAVPLLPPLLTDKLAAISKRYSDLASQVPAMSPPALNSVGDKLTDSALVESIARRSEPHRPYLLVQMPRFPLSEDDLQALVHHLIDTDRVPPRAASGGVSAPPSVEQARRDRYALAGSRLVSSDGFGCTSCHAIGRVQPASDSPGARGPDLLGLERRIRRPWFDRWVRNPSRIVPRMEMPSVQIPVAGLLDDKLDEQLNAVWHVLNLPGFEPPLPNPIRTLRNSGNQHGAGPIILTDILEQGKQTRIKPFLIGLANRHNVLFDLESGALAQWRVGDVVRQHTRGKSWFWEPAGAVVLDTALTQPDLSLNIDGCDLVVHPLGQFLTEADAWQIEGTSVCLYYRLKFSTSENATRSSVNVRPHAERGNEKDTIVHIRRKWAPSATGFIQELSLDGAPVGAKMRLHLISAERAAQVSRTTDGRTIRLGDRFASRIVLSQPSDGKFTEDARALLLAPDEKGALCIVLHYESDIPTDRFPEAPQPSAVTRKGEPVEVAPGFTGIRLSLPPDIMPTGLCWRPDGRLIFCSLKGQVFEAIDTNGDGIEDCLNLLADGLPAPYGVHAEADYVDISAKYALLRLYTALQRVGLRQRAECRRIQTIASGWGYSPDYHDWAVGLPQNNSGEYFLGIPCQQDKRSPAAARFHGHILRLTPRKPTRDDPHLFALTPISAGHRFPMGLALNHAGDLFVTDNQGNYKPFNELNHVRPGTHFGFINFLDRSKPTPPRTLSAIDIPHPWTRSVNGICFLYTPKELRNKRGTERRRHAFPHETWEREGIFGPLEGHLIGCEYDTRRLVRMTLQRVGDTFQGAAYPLSIPPSDPQRGFLGPLVCAVSPRGELYVGSIRDSGWGAGANVGEIVRVQIQPDKLPCGIAEVQATHDGFQIDFFHPIDRDLAGRIESYTIQSYRREATPAYGSPDRDRRTEKLTDVIVSSDACRVTLKLAEMRPGFVYELRLKDLAPGGGAFHPAEAYYTLNAVPK
jgi:cytochrome c553